MINLFILLSCPAPIIENTSGLEWTKHDSKILNYSYKRCAQVYKDAPCLKRFIKHDFQAYSVICGGE